jgi:hypothetical protein
VYNFMNCNLISSLSNVYLDNLAGVMNPFKLLRGAGQGIDRHIHRPTARSDGRSGELTNSENFSM